MAVLPSRFGVVAVLGILAVAGMLPTSAAAKGDHSSSGARASFSVHPAAHNGRTGPMGRVAIPRRAFAESQRRGRFGHRFANDLSDSFWPYGAYFDGLPADDYSSGADISGGPEVFVLPPTTSPPQGIAEPVPPLDFSYVPGCRPIPNGYHCDDANRQASK